MSQENLHSGIAFAITIGAGMSTALGAGVVFLPTWSKYGTRKTLAGGLGFAAGVMTYVSFGEVIRKAENQFQAAGFSQKMSFALSTAGFFGGIVFVAIFNKLTDFLIGFHHRHNNGENDTSQHRGFDPFLGHKCGVDLIDEIAAFREIEQRAIDLGIETWEDDQPTPSPQSTIGNAPNSPQKTIEASRTTSDDCTFSTRHRCNSNDPECSTIDNVEQPRDEEEKKKLLKMSINTAIAICIHNFPEGLATFVAALGDPKVGASLGIAIALHNVPEGLCVAMPIYHATGSKWKAFLCGVVSGLSEPFAALLGWVFLANFFSATLFGVFFAVVSGMMVTISSKELLPIAHRYDPDDSVVTNSFVAGMAVMAISLLLFLL